MGGKGFVMIAGDTRLSKGYSILNRKGSKVHKLTNNCYLATSGMYADFCCLKKKLDIRVT